MKLGFAFFLNSVLFGVGLAMDAFSVSIANAIADPDMKHGQRLRIAGCFALFQVLMPLAGWLCVRTIAESFTAFQRFIPWIALILLLWIGGKMLFEGIRGRAEGEAEETKTLGRGTLLLQGVATSIDALSVGFTIEEYPLPAALIESLIIGAVTLAICLAGLFLGRTIGRKLDRIAPILGGIILIGIGVEIFLTGIF
ncbi:MAG: manganese efflux pump [Oscillospiraceae bacterium]|nr:manganese efflux pump [Oscillospiraceae bacterium]